MTAAPRRCRDSRTGSAHRHRRRRTCRPRICIEKASPPWSRRRPGRALTTGASLRPDDSHPKDTLILERAAGIVVADGIGEGFLHILPACAATARRLRHCSACRCTRRSPPARANRTAPRTRPAPPRPAAARRRSRDRCASTLPLTVVMPSSDTVAAVIHRDRRIVRALNRDGEDRRVLLRVGRIVAHGVAEGLGEHLGRSERACIGGNSRRACS